MTRYCMIFASVLLAAALLAPAAAQPIRSAETEWSGVTLDIHSVERKAGVLTVKWGVRNQGDSAQDVGFCLLSGQHVRTYVVDMESGTKYYVLTDKEGHALATASGYVGDGYGPSKKVEPGRQARFWMKLPAPPPEIDSVMLVFDGLFEPLEDVPISEG